ncbi:MAG: lipoprotein [Massilia sp.]
MRKISILGTVVLIVLAGCSKSDSNLADCSQMTSERARTHCLAHKEATANTDVSRAQQSPPKKW